MMEVKTTRRQRSIQEKYAKKYIRYRQRLVSRLGFPTTFIISYPNCGRTWLRLMLGYYIINRLALKTDAYLDIQTFNALDRRAPRLSIHHDDRPYKLKPDQLTRHKERYRFDNIIFLVRDPRDVIVSRFHAARHRQKDPFDGDISAFVREEKGSLASLIEYWNIWYGEKDKVRKFLCVHYEDLHSDARPVLLRILDVLEMHPVDETLLQQAVSFAAFDNMRKMEEENALKRRMLQPIKKGDFRTYKTRRGIVGDHRDSLTGEDLTYINQLIAERLHKDFGYR